MSSIFQADIIEDYKQLYELKKVMIEFSDEWMKKQNGYFIFKKPKFSVKFIYCGTANINNIEDAEIVKILNAADELELIKFIQEYLIMNKIKILHQDPTICPIAHQGLENLAKTYLETVCHNPEILLEPDKFFSLEEDVIIFNSQK
ncbi:hypothetical protein Glove_421g13 [Diversispora epigaea]|uniref:BTB domain-containing protein n=1 Tax=Diversispora epigaea TaxID=1348612 RepID=A0A397GZ42_9GLOM|nr:hypothetical protein Glove_421g13 [Diversispora epigaea]